MLRMRQWLAHNQQLAGKAVSDTVFDIINAIYYDKPLIFTRAKFQEKLISHHQEVNINHWTRLSLSRLFLILY